MKKISMFFVLIFILIIYAGFSSQVFGRGAGFWLEYHSDNVKVRAASYHPDYVHKVSFYSFGDPGYSIGTGCNGIIARGNWDTKSEPRYPSTGKKPIIFKVYYNQSCY